MYQEAHFFDDLTKALIATNSLETHFDRKPTGRLLGLSNLTIKAGAPEFKYNETFFFNRLISVKGRLCGDNREPHFSWLSDFEQSSFLPKIRKWRRNPCKGRDICQTPSERAIGNLKHPRV